MTSHGALQRCVYITLAFLIMSTQRLQQQQDDFYFTATINASVVVFISDCCCFLLEFWAQSRDAGFLIRLPHASVSLLHHILGEGTHLLLFCAGRGLKTQQHSQEHQDAGGGQKSHHLKEENAQSTNTRDSY
jgi:hypothetical protein